MGVVIGLCFAFAGSVAAWRSATEADHPGAACVEWSQSDSSVRMPVTRAIG